MTSPVFSIVTPSYNMLAYLQLCHQSIADQEVELEHIVIDGASTDGTAEWLQRRPEIKSISEPDDGMYDAVNKGLAMATGDILAYLNCDEQYLPGALRIVEAFFTSHPDVDVAVGDVVVVDADGDYVCSRQTLIPLQRHTVICQLNTLTGATFFRRSIVERGLVFNNEFKNVGDAEWMARLLEAKIAMGHIPEWLTAFSETGDNLGIGPAYQAEKTKLVSRFPRWWGKLAFGWTTHHRLRRLLAGHYAPKPLLYSIYAAGIDGRMDITVDHPTFMWKARQ